VLQPSTAVTSEENSSASNAVDDGLLLIEGVDEAVVKTAASNLAARAPELNAPAPIYTTIFALDRRLL
jgi:hypothetical protein